MIRRVLVAAVVAGLAATPANAYFEELGIGARGLALGLGYGAMVSDASAHYWNPAALTNLRQPEGTADYAKPYSLSDLNAGAISLAAPLGAQGVALGWHHLGLTDTYSEDLFTVAAARRVYRDHAGHTLSAGLAYKLGRIAFQSFRDPVSSVAVNYGSIARSSLDAGLLWQTPWSFDVGWVARDLLEPRYEFVHGTGGQRLVTRQELSAAVHWNPESTILFGWAQSASGPGSITAGLEVTFFNVFAIRSSIANLTRITESYGSPNDLELNGGFGVFHKGYYVDATATTDHDLGASYRVSLRAPLPGSAH